MGNPIVAVALIEGDVGVSRADVETTLKWGRVRTEQRGDYKGIFCMADRDPTMKSSLEALKRGEDELHHRLRLRIHNWEHISLRSLVGGCTLDMSSIRIGKFASSTRVRRDMSKTNFFKVLRRRRGQSGRSGLNRQRQG